MPRITGVLILAAVVVFPLQVRANACPNSGGSMSKLLSLMKAVEQERMNLCTIHKEKPIPENVIKSVIIRIESCVKLDLEPCGQKKMPEWWAIMNKCNKNKKLLSISGLCTGWDEFISCTGKEFEIQKQPLLENAGRNVGLLCTKVEKFRKCIHDALIRVK